MSCRSNFIMHSSSLPCYRTVRICVIFVVSTCWAIPSDRQVIKEEVQTIEFSGSGNPKWVQDKTDGSFGDAKFKLTSAAGENSANRTGRGQCGTTKIVGGGDAEDHWPWQAELYVKRTGRHLCGGTVIDSKHVLTAAHCFDRFDKNEILVRVGSSIRTLQESNEETYPIACLHVHSRYRAGDNYDYDIALIKLKTEAEASGPRRMLFNEQVAPVCLPRRGEFGAGKQCIVTGWGYTDFRSLLLGRFPSKLKEANVPLISAKTCRGAYGFTLSRRMVCAGHMNGEWRADTCKGDSGGPLVCQSEDGTWKLWGVTSWGWNYFCNPSPTDPSPGVYTRVDRFLNWIDKKMSKKYCAV